MGSCRKNRRHRLACAGLNNNVEKTRKACNIEDPHGKPGQIPWNDLFCEKSVSIHTANRTKGAFPLDGAVTFKVEGERPRSLPTASADQRERGRN